MTSTYLSTNDLQIGMKTTVKALSHIINTYMILLYDHAGDKEGTLVYANQKQTSDYDKWFLQDKPITPIHHTKDELEENVVYDE